MQYFKTKPHLTAPKGAEEEAAVEGDLQEDKGRSLSTVYFPCDIISIRKHVLYATNRKSQIMLLLAFAPARVWMWVPEHIVTLLLGTTRGRRTFLPPVQWRVKNKVSKVKYTHQTLVSSGDEIIRRTGAHSNSLLSVMGICSLIPRLLREMYSNQPPRVPK